MKTLLVGSNGLAVVIFPVLMLGVIAGVFFWRNTRSGKVLTQEQWEPLNDVTSAIVDINTGTGNLSIDGLIGDASMLASGSLQYLENKPMPVWTLDSSNGLGNLSVQMPDDGHNRSRLPWSACNGAYEWALHLNQTVRMELSAYSGGGNLSLNLAGMEVTRVVADSGGGNLAVILPDYVADLDVTARTGAGNVDLEVGQGTTGNNVVTAESGAGNVSVSLPSGIAVRVHATTSLGKVIIDPKFSLIDKDVYQSQEFESASDRVELWLKSGAGTVTVSVR